MLSVINRKQSQPGTLPQWIEENAKVWVLNQNLLNSKRIFLEGVVVAVPSEDDQLVSVEVTTDNQKATIEVSHEIVFQRTVLAKNKQLNLEDLAKIQYNNHAEIFRFLSEKLKVQKRYFECGVDFFYINDYSLMDPNVATQEAVVVQRKLMKEAVDWLGDEKSLKPNQANPFSFLASLIKNYWWSLEVQTVFLCGEYQSGKSANFNKLIEFIGYYNVSSVDSFDLESIRNRNISLKQRVTELEKFIEENPVIRNPTLTASDFVKLPDENKQSSLNPVQSIFSFNVKDEANESNPNIEDTKAIQDQSNRPSKLSNAKKPTTQVPKFSSVSKGKLSNVSHQPIKSKESVTSQNNSKVFRNTSIDKNKTNKKSVSKGKTSSKPDINGSSLQKSSKMPTPSQLKTKTQRAELYEAFKRELQNANVVLEPFVRCFEKNGMVSSAALTVIRLDTDERHKFIGFNFKVRMLRTHRLLGQVS
jgi:hypothetical protein